MNERAFISGRPRFKVDGRLREDLQQSLTGMVINRPLHGSAHAEITLTNWGTPEGGSAPDFIYSDIGLGAEVEIEMEDAETVNLFKGEITAVEESYGQGAPSLALLMQDRLHHLARSRQSRSYEEQTPDDIVQAIASDAGLRAAVQISNIIDDWHQLNESDLAFLLRLAGRFDVGLRLVDETLRARPEEADPEPLPLDAQDSALRVQLMADLNFQPTAAEVRGYNAGTAEPVDHTSDSLNPSPHRESASDQLGQLGWEGEEILPHPFARSQAEAEAYADAHFHRQAKRFIQGEIVCQGEARITSGREIELTGVSSRMAGAYQVVHCVHRFDNQSGFETHLKVNKPDWSPSP